MEYLVGIDGGGTSCRAVIARADGIVLGRGRSGSANIVTNMEEAFASITTAMNEALVDAGLDLSVLDKTCAVLGLAGANIGTYDQVLMPRLPFSKSTIVSDMHIALSGALGDEDGAVAIVGTGSAFISKSKGQVRAIGGWGFTIGDFCSGARLGRSLLQETLLAYDGVRPGSPLTMRILKDFENNPETIVEYAQKAQPRDFGQFASIVFEYEEQDDRIAKDIICEAVHNLEESLGTLIHRDQLSFCILGGLAPQYAKRLSPAYKRHYRAPQADALEGALFLARSSVAPNKGECYHNA